MRMIKMPSYLSAAGVSAIAALLLSGCGAEAETARGAGAAASAPSGEAATPVPDSVTAPPDSAEVARAREILAEVGRAYRESPALSDSIKVYVQEQPQVMRLRFSPGNERIEMALPTATATKIDDTLFVTHELMFDVYLEQPLEKDMPTAIRETLGWVPPYHFAMRLTEDVDAYVAGLGLGIMRAPRVRGSSTIVDDAGNEVHRVRLESAEGTAYVHVDPQRNVITGITMDLLPGQGQPAHASRVELRVETEPVMSDELDEPITFEPGDRLAVHDPREMEPRPLRTGDNAPNFMLETPEGETIYLRDLRGNVVVLDFWATWCVPCIIALPHFDRFAQWAEGSEHPVKVFAVNTMERAATGEERLALATNFWNEKEFSVPLLFDRGNLAAPRTGYNSLPLTLVIDPNGRISRVHDGFKRDMYQILRADTERALREAPDTEPSE